jgi:uncharacterized PurR-regulated membrane protein YhhQ (DUF165 family)
MKAAVYVSLYIAAIVAANVTTAHTAPLMIGAFAVTNGTWFIAATFPLRDAVQLHAGRRASYAAIGVALGASAATSSALGDTLAITAASALAFAVSESIDTETFTRLRCRLSRRVLISGMISAPIDSVLFAVVGLSPLGAGFVAWSDLWRVIAAQIVAKSIVQAVVAPAARRLLLAPSAA